MTPDIKDENLSTVLEDFFVKFFILGESNISNSQRLVKIWTGDITLSSHTYESYESDSLDFFPSTLYAVISTRTHIHDKHREYTPIAFMNRLSIVFRIPFIIVLE